MPIKPLSVSRKVQKWLLDIRTSIQSIQSFLQENPDFEDYKDNLMLRRAVERELEILGEAVNRILKQEPDYPLTDARRIVDLCNHVIHRYDNVSDEIIWGILHKNLPVLKSEVEILCRKGRAADRIAGRHLKMEATPLALARRGGGVTSRGLNTPAAETF